MFLKRIYNKSKQSLFSIRYVRNLLCQDALILMYHRVADVQSDPWSLAVRPKYFAEQMEIIRQYGNPVSLQQLRKNIQEKKMLTRSVVITFDDGYADNLYNAKSILEKYDIPATVFVITSCIDQNREFWWDELDRLLLQTESLPKVLQLTIRGKTYRWKTEDPAHSSNGDPANSGSGEERMKPHKALYWRQNLYYKIYNLLRLLDASERDRALQELRLWADTGLANPNSQFSLTGNDLIALEKNGLIEIGAHTVSHPHLSKIPLNMQWDEINNSKVHLENILGHEVNSFAYPFGSYTKRTVSLVKKAGFNCACSCVFSKVKRRNNLNLLPRIPVEDLDGETFARWMSKIAW